MEEILKKNEKGKKITCGIVLMDKEKNILTGHPTGKSLDKGNYDLLKGCANEGEDDLDCAIRELKEEARFNAEPYRDSIIDLGVHNYNREKMIHLFLLNLEKMPSLLHLSCDSYFKTKGGETLPEMNGYRIVRLDDRSWLFPRLLKVIENIPELN